MDTDDLFTSGEDWWHNACLNFTSDDWNLYSLGYKEAADILIDQIISENRRTRSVLDMIVYPIVFLYRQYLELRLKHLIVQYQELGDIPIELPKTHAIDSLWEKLKTLLIQIDPQNASTARDMFEEIEGCISQFSETDPSSTAFRYPVDTKGNSSLLGIKHINVRHLHEVLENVSSHLENISWEVSYQTHQKAEYIDAMKTLYGDDNLWG